MEWALLAGGVFYLLLRLLSTDKIRLVNEEDMKSNIYKF